MKTKFTLLISMVILTVAFNQAKAQDKVVAKSGKLVTVNSDAAAGTKGIIQLAGDLGGTAASPTVPGLALKAPIAGPVFTGDAQATTAAVGDSDTSVATTAFVATAVTNGVAAGAPDATNLVKGKVQLAGDLSGTAALPTVTNAAVIGKVLTGFTSATGALSATDSVLGAIQKLDGNTALKAPLASPTFTGTPTLPTGTIGVTQSAGNNTTAVATTAFVTTAVANGVAAGAVTSAQEEITATANQTSFTAVNVPKTNSLIFYINGVKVPMSAITISGTPAKTITYNPVNNDNYSISLNDVITLAYLY